MFRRRVIRAQHGLSASGAAGANPCCRADGVQASIGEARFDAVWTEVQRLGDKLDALEAFNGQTFYAFAGGNMSSGAGTINLAAAGDNPIPGVVFMGDIPLVVTLNPNQLTLLQQSHAALKQSVYDGLALQTRLKGYLDAVGLTLDENGIRFDFSGVDAALDARAQTDRIHAIVDCLDLARYGSTLVSAGWNGQDKLVAMIVAASDSGELDALKAEIASAFATDTGGISVKIGGGGNDTIHAGAGDDLVMGGDGNDTLNGEAGNDTLIGGAGNDTLNGGLGNDTYRFGKGDGQDLITYDSDTTTGKKNVLQFEAGIDPAEIEVIRSGPHLVLSIAGSTDKVTLHCFFYADMPGTHNYNPIQEVRFADGTKWDTAALVAKALTVGTDGADTLTGTAAGDRIEGGGGNDTIHAGAGDDLVMGGDGNDTLNGEAGNDTLNGGAGNDYLSGGNGADSNGPGTIAISSTSSSSPGMATLNANRRASNRKRTWRTRRAAPGKSRRRCGRCAGSARN